MKGEAGVDDRRVLDVQRVGHRVQVLRLRGVVLVAADAARRDHGDEDVVRVGRVADRGAQIGQVAPELLLADVGHRARAAERDGGCGGAAGHRALQVLLVVLGEGVDLRLEAVERAAVRARLVAAEPLADVGEEAGLALLAVADDVQAGRALPGDGVRYGESLGLRPQGRFYRPAFRGGLHQVEQCRRAREAADVGGVDALGAVPHGGRLP
jgi:hypothetical protein